jgi:hypothetical protein
MKKQKDRHNKMYYESKIHFLRLTKRTQNTINWTTGTCRMEDIKHYQEFIKKWAEFEAGRLK